MFYSISKWSGDVLRTLKLENGNSVSNFKKLIQTSLFKMFIENELNLHTLEIEILSGTIYTSYLNNIFELILQNTNCFRNIKNFKLSMINFTNNSLIKNRLLQIINLHQNLKKIVLCYKSILLHRSLSKDYNCSNTLNTIILYNVNLNRIINSENIFDQLNVLESVHFINCSSFDTRFIQQIINLTKPFKLKTLFIEEKLQIDESLQLLFHIYGDSLENFGSGLDYHGLLYEQQLFELITKYCKNIKFLNIYNIYNIYHSKNKIIFLLFNLIKNINHNLNYLSIKCESINSSSILLRNLGQILPSKLDYLNLFLFINASDFELFLKNSQGTFIKKLLIRDLIQKNNNNILHYIKEYIMMEKRVRYLAFIDIKWKELFDLNDEVKEFKLYDIIVKRYNNLVINDRQFMQKLN